MQLTEQVKKDIRVVEWRRPVRYRHEEVRRCRELVLRDCPALVGVDYSGCRSQKLGGTLRVHHSGIRLRAAIRACR